MLQFLFIFAIVLQISQCQVLVPGVYNINITDNNYFLQTGDLQWNQIVRLNFTTPTNYAPNLVMQLTGNNQTETVVDNAYYPSPNIYVSNSVSAYKITNSFEGSISLR